MQALGYPESTPVAKRSNGAGKPQPPPPDGTKTERVEFLAAKDWIARVDAAAEALGMGRSAYIRMCVNLKMAADRRPEGP